MTDITELLQKLDNRLARIESKLDEEQQPKITKEWFSIAEAAEILGRAPFTVREWARLGRINAAKRESGRRRASEWVVAREEIERIANEGLLP